MRHSGPLFRQTTVYRALRILLLPAILAAAAAPVPAMGAAAAERTDVTGLRLGRHAGFLRLVFDLTARPEYGARATAARVFEVSLPRATLPPEGHAALAADPLAPDLIVRPAAGGGALRFRVTSNRDAFIRRAFVLAPPAGAAAAPGATPWRLVLDIVPRPGHGAGPAPATDGATPLAILPPPHGLDAPGLIAEEAAPAMRDSPVQVAVSWARASRILRELQARRAPDADAAVPPQLVLPPRYRQTPVPLR